MGCGSIAVCFDRDVSAIKSFVKIEFLFFLLAYYALLLGASFLLSRKIKNLEDFFLASRRLPAILVFLTLAASWIGATSVLVSVDEAYTKGVSSFWVMGVPAVLTVLFLAFFLVRPIRSLPIVSLPDLVEVRYGRTVRHLASLLIVWYMILLAASQMVAVGNFLKYFLGTSYFYSLLLGTAVVLVYSVFGGFFSVVITDGLQFFLLAAGIVGLCLFVMNISTPSEISNAAAQLGKREYFLFCSDFGTNFLVALSFTLAWIVSPIAWQRIQAARTAGDAKKGLFAAAATLFILFGCLVLIGMFSLPFLSSRSMNGPVLSEMIASRTGMLLGGILFVAVVAAIMSTMDTAINTGALSLTKDIYLQIFRSRAEGSAVAAGRASTIVITVLAFLVATRFQSILRTLGLASEIMAEGLFIPGLAMLFIKRRFPLAGLFSLVLGGGYSVAGFLCAVGVMRANWPSWPHSLPYGLLLCFAGFVCGIILDSFRGKR
jgi:SSS family solute:Na+ symporter